MYFALVQVSQLEYCNNANNNYKANNGTIINNVINNTKYNKQYRNNTSQYFIRV